MNSIELFEKSKKLVPGGVHSPVRSFKGLKQTPIFFERSCGAYLYDVEGKDYIDFCMSFGPLLLGHRNKAVEGALAECLQKVHTFGAAEPYSLELAQLIIDKIPFIEQIRFMNSGTEAVMTALRLARGYTGRDKIIKFNGCYHGHTDSMLIKAGSGLAMCGEASSAGIPKSVAQDTLVLELGDLEGVREYFRKFGTDIAAIIIEPLPANYGLLPQDVEFLKKLREITKEYRSLLIFDEVISGFRVCFGGMAQLTQIDPDIVTYGKVIGGGLPVGAVASRKEIMQFLAPIGPVYQAGTLSANPLAMVAGLATLKQLTNEVYSKIDDYSEKIAQTFNRWFKQSTNREFRSLEIVRRQSLFWIVSKEKSFANLFEILLDKGIYLSPNVYEVAFCSLAHDQKVIEELERRLWG